MVWCGEALLGIVGVLGVLQRCLLGGTAGLKALRKKRTTFLHQSLLMVGIEGMGGWVVFDRDI